MGGTVVYSKKNVTEIVQDSDPMRAVHAAVLFAVYFAVAVHIRCTFQIQCSLTSLIAIHV
jgi:hypothetical protein